MSEVLAGFEGLVEYYPGSKTPVRTVPVHDHENQTDEDLCELVFLLGESQTHSVAGRDVEFFTIGQLAYALNRSATTLRRWESQGTIPKSGYTKPSKDPRGKRRLYTKQQCEGILKIALEEGILRAGATIKTTKFSERVVQLFKDLKSKP